jgi:hypothetical protein
MRWAGNIALMGKTRDLYTIIQPENTKYDNHLNISCAHNNNDSNANGNDNNNKQNIQHGK